MPCWRSIDFDQIKGTSGSKAMESTNHFNFLLRMIFASLRTYELVLSCFNVVWKVSPSIRAIDWFLFTESIRSHRFEKSVNVWLWKRVHLQFEILLNSFKQCNCHMSSKVMILTLLKAILTVNLFLLSIFFPIQITVTIPMQESKIEPSLLKRPPSHKLISGQ